MDSSRSVVQVLGALVILGASYVVADSLTGPVKGTAAGDEAAGAVTNGAPVSANDAAMAKANETPQFWQRDTRGGFANGGRDYCCPVAVSNSLVYLARHGFPGLLPGGGDGIQAQIDLINHLASPDYMGTDPDNGTAPEAVLAGVEKYVEEKGYECARLEYEGWRHVGQRNRLAVKAARPALDWLEEGIREPNGAVWLNVGWYKEIEPGHWKRTGGHWVTLVGYEETDAAGGVAASPRFLIHNPARRGDGMGTDYLGSDAIDLEPVSGGKLDTTATWTMDATGMYEVFGPGFPARGDVHGKAAFLDAAVVFVVESKIHAVD